MASNEIFEFRGVDKLMFAKVISDTKDGYKTGEVKWLSPTAEIGRTTSSSSEAHYYDNKPMIIINSVGSDELKLTVAPLDLETYAEITGQIFDPTTGALIEGNRSNEYFAIGYRTKGTDGKYRYVWRYKGQFSIPDETSSTENDGTDTNNTELTWTGVETVFEFEKGDPVNNKKKSAKAIICDERYDAVDFETFFDIVNTPDTLNGTGLKKVGQCYSYPRDEVGATPTTYTGQIYVTLKCETEGATIWYTTDGTNVSLSAPAKQYVRPFAINKTTTIKFMAVKKGMANSNNYTSTYTIS